MQSIILFKGYQDEKLVSQQYRARPACTSVQSDQALHWWQRLITLSSSRIRVKIGKHRVLTSISLVSSVPLISFSLADNIRQAQAQSLRFCFEINSWNYIKIGSNRDIFPSQTISAYRWSQEDHILHCGHWCDRVVWTPEEEDKLWQFCFHFTWWFFITSRNVSKVYVTNFDMVTVRSQTERKSIP